MPELTCTMFETAQRTTASPTTPLVSEKHTDWRGESPRKAEAANPIESANQQKPSRGRSVPTTA
jgi:hypothetical protein